jgi:hypothetical protein
VGIGLVGGVEPTVPVFIVWPAFWLNTPAFGLKKVVEAAGGMPRVIGFWNGFWNIELGLGCVGVALKPLAPLPLLPLEAEPPPPPPPPPLA